MEIKVGGAYWLGKASTWSKPINRVVVVKWLEGDTAYVDIINSDKNGNYTDKGFICRTKELQPVTELQEAMYGD